MKQTIVKLKCVVCVIDIVLKGKKEVNFVQLVSHGGTIHFNQRNLLGSWRKIEDVFNYVLLM